VGIRTWVVSLAVLATATAAPAHDEALRVSEVVKDSSGAAVPGASVSLLSAQQAVVSTTRTDERGTFTLKVPAPGHYVVAAEVPGLTARRQAVSSTARMCPLDLRLEPARVSEEITVTANPGSVSGVDAVSQQVNVINETDIAERAKDVIAQIANEEVGIHLQRTSPTMAGIFVRGLTGAKVSVYVDGQRCSTGAAHSGRPASARGWWRATQAPASPARQMAPHGDHAGLTGYAHRPTIRRSKCQ